MIERQEPLLKVLRLLCLYSGTHGGIPSSSFSSLRAEIIQTYGFESMLLLNNLDKMGYISRGGNAPQYWKNLVQLLDLYDTSFIKFTKELRYTDLHAVYDGYMPMSVAIIKKALTGEKIGWDGMEKVLDTIPGPYKSKQQIGAMGKNLIVLY
jgi:hypothetical protein